MFFGIFKQLRDLNLQVAADYDLYQGEMAKVYDLLVNATAESHLFLAQAALCGEPILELACGSGRMLAEFAKAGYAIHGIDLSGDMLDLLAEKLKSLPNRVRSKIGYECHDMTTFDRPNEYGLITLPATSMCLLPTPDHIKNLVARTYGNLRSGGRFVFDYTVHRPSQALTFESRISAITVDKGQKQFVLYGEQKNFAERMAHLNFYSEIEAGEGLKRFFGYTTKHFIDERFLLDCLTETGFGIVEHTVIGELEHETVKFLVLEKR